MMHTTSISKKATPTRQKMSPIRFAQVMAASESASIPRVNKKI